MACSANRVLLALLIGWWALRLPEAAKGAHDTPNIVVLMSDDAGYADFGFQAHTSPDYQNLTPRIDSIAANGCRLSAAYMSGCVCSPSRAGLMTGRYQQRFGHDNNLPPGYMRGGLALTETLMAKRFQEIGYRTALIGKWHLGYPDPYQPNARGFDYFYGCLQGSRKYFPIESVSPHRVFLENKTPTPEEGYLTDRIGDGACQFISDNRETPFFLIVSFTAPHGPLEAKPEHLQKLSHIRPAKRRKNAGLIMSLDENVGKILDHLQQLELTANTLLVFTNDNGGQTQYAARNLPLRGRKGQLWEGGIRVPMAIQWPSRIAAEKVIDEPVISLDLFPTFWAAAKQDLPAAWQLDGQNLLPLLQGEAESLPARDLYWRRQGPPGPIAMRRDQWKLLVPRDQEDPAPQLFDLSQDIAEAENLAAQKPDLVKVLLQALREWESQLQRPQWGPNSVDN